MLFLYSDSSDANYHSDSNYSNHPIIRTPPSPGKIIIAFKHPRLKPISKHLHLAELEQGSLTVTAELEQGLPNIYYRCFQTSTRVLLSLQSSNRGWQTCTRLRQSLQSLNKGCQTCTSLRRSLRSSNGGCHSVLI